MKIFSTKVEEFSCHIAKKRVDGYSRLHRIKFTKIMKEKFQSNLIFRKSFQTPIL